MDSSTLDDFLKFPLHEIPFVFLVLLIAFTLHEFAHAYTADRFGDPTPREMGRVTLNPRVHLDVLGTILIFIAGFGWAKPVMIKQSNFKNPRLMGIIVSLAGPLANLLIAFLGMLSYYVIAYFHLFDDMSKGLLDAVVLFLDLMIRLNIMLFIFNLLPLPPLDGYRILQDFLPWELRLKVQQFEQWAIYLFLLIVFIPQLNNFTLRPILALAIPILSGFDFILHTIFGEVRISR